MDRILLISSLICLHGVNSQSTTERVTAEEGYYAVLPCSLINLAAYPEWLGPPGQSVTFTYEDGSAINPRAGGVASRLTWINNYDLKITDVKLEDAGDYQCSYSGLGDHTITLVVTRGVDHVKIVAIVMAIVMAIVASILVLVITGVISRLVCSCKVPKEYVRITTPTCVITSTDVITGTDKIIQFDATENIPIELECEISPGRPLSPIKWYRSLSDSAVIEELPHGVTSTLVSLDGFSLIRKSKLKYTPGKSDDGNRFFCSASNSGNESPLTSNTQIQLNVSGGSGDDAGGDQQAGGDAVHPGELSSDCRTENETISTGNYNVKFNNKSGRSEDIEMREKEEEETTLLDEP